MYLDTRRRRGQEEKRREGKRRGEESLSLPSFYVGRWEMGQQIGPPRSDESPSQTNIAIAIARWKNLESRI